jgi:SAM-dependent methyltransferase
MTNLGQRTIDDFGEQFTNYTTNDGYYASAAFMGDMLGPLLKLDDLKGQRIAEIGSGSGRIVKMLLEAGAAHVTATEPSSAFPVLVETVGGDSRVECIKVPGDQLPAGDFDYVFCIGVMQFIPETAPVVKAAHDALKPGGGFVVRIYSYEGNEAYLKVLMPIRFVTTKVPHAVLAGLVRVLDFGLVGYLALCKFLPLPMRGYFNDVIRKLEPDKRRLVIYDQVNPSYVRYYKRSEAEALMRGRFEDVQLFHHDNTCWTILGRRPKS